MQANFNLQHFSFSVFEKVCPLFHCSLVVQLPL
jgi:hypothetical protein